MKHQYYIKKLFSVCLNAIAVNMFWLFAGFSLAKGGENVDANKVVSINLCAVGNETNAVICAVVRNNSKADIGFSRLEVFGNCVYVLKPDGSIQVSSINADLPHEFVYNPQFIIKSGSEVVYKAISEDDQTSPLYPLKRKIEKQKQPGRYEAWFDLVDWVDFSKGKFNKYTSNHLVFYVGADGKKTFVNDPKAIAAFKGYGMEIGNSAAQVDVEETVEGNYRLHKITPVYSAKKAVAKQLGQHSILAWIVATVVALAACYFILKRFKRRKTASA